MEGISLKPKQAVLTASVTGLALLTALSLVLPEGGVLFAAAIPLLACPLVGHKQEPFGWAASAAPAASALIACLRADCFERCLPYVFSLLLTGCGPMLFTRCVPAKKRLGGQGMLWYVAIAAAGLTATAGSAAYLLGGPLQTALTQHIVAMVEKSEQPGLLLFRLASAGFVNMPENLPRSEMLLRLFEPLMVREMLLSFRLTLEMLLGDLLPSAVVQGSIITGLFTALRVDRMNGVVLMVETKSDKPSEKKAIVAVPPGFGLMSLPGHLRMALAVMAVLSAVLGGSAQSFEAMLGLLMYHTFTVCFQLQGAAVLVGVCMMRWPDRRVLIGALAAAVYLMAPMALFLIGVTDQVFHYRSKRVRETD